MNRTTTEDSAASRPPTEGDWWDGFFPPEAGDLFLARTDSAERQATVDFLREALRLPQGGRVCDQCCGIGSLSIALAQSGYRVCGVDLSDPFIRRAKTDAAVADVACEFTCGDALEFVAQPACDGVFNWYSSFGYAADDERNRQMLCKAADSLKPGGRFALDVPNFPGLLRNFQHYLVRRGEVQGQAVLLIRDSQLNFRRGLLEQTWTWHIGARPPVQRRSALRIYLPHQIAEMLAVSGFAEIEFFGGLAKQPFELDSPRLIVTATRTPRETSG